MGFLSRAPDVSSSFLHCLPGDLSGSSQPHSVWNWPPPHTQGQRDPPQGFLAAVWMLRECCGQQRDPWGVPAVGVRQGAVGALPSNLTSSPWRVSVWALGHGMCLLPSLWRALRFSPLPRCIMLIHSCSSPGIFPVLTRGLWVSWGEGELREGPLTGSVQRRQRVRLSPSLAGWRVLQTPRASVFAAVKWAPQRPSF